MTSPPLTDMIGARAVQGTKAKLTQQSHRLGHSNLSEYVRVIFEAIALQDEEELDDAYRAQTRREEWNETEWCPLFDFVRNALCEHCTHRSLVPVQASDAESSPDSAKRDTDPLDELAEELMKDT